MYDNSNAKTLFGCLVNTGNKTQRSSVGEDENKLGLQNVQRKRFSTHFLSYVFRLSTLLKYQ